MLKCILMLMLHLTEHTPLSQSVKSAQRHYSLSYSGLRLRVCFSCTDEVLGFTYTIQIRNSPLPTYRELPQLCFHLTEQFCIKLTFKDV